MDILISGHDVCHIYEQKGNLTDSTILNTGEAGDNNTNLFNGTCLPLFSTPIGKPVAATKKMQLGFICLVVPYPVGMDDERSQKNTDVVFAAADREGQYLSHEQIRTGFL